MSDMPIQGKAAITIDCECWDKDGNLKWVNKVEIPLVNEKENSDGGKDHD